MVTARSAVEVRRLRQFRSLPWPGPLRRKAARGALALQMTPTRAEGHHLSGPVAGKTDPTIVRTDDALFCGDPHSMSQISWRTPCRDMT